ncbi:MAG: ABC transporter ATP-binding protein [Clostridiales bacterium]|nr:ABC transporter ATP-binding protein [Clostridiales bacterium]
MNMKCQNKPHIYTFKLLKYIWSFDKQSIILTCFTSVISAFISLVILYLPKVFIDYILNANITNALFIILLYVLVVILFNIVVGISSYILQINEQKRLFHIVRDMMLHTLKINYEYIENSEFLNAYNRRLNNMQNACKQVIALLSNLFNQILTIGVIIGLFASLNMYVILIALVMVIVDIVISLIVNKLEYKMSIESQKQHKKFNVLARIFYLYNSIREIKTLNINKEVTYKYDETVNENLNIYSKFKKKSSFLNIISSIITESGPVIPMIMFGKFVLDKIISISTYFLYINAYSEFKNSIKLIFGIIPQLFVNELYCKDFFEYMEDETLTTIINNDGIILDEINEIRFENVSFKYYGSDKMILNDISFVIKKGEKVAFVGHNGAGKSTIIKLMCGLYKPDQGNIYINGINIHDFKTTSFYEKISILFQDYYVFPFTIRENITAFRKEVNEEQINKMINLFSLQSKIESLQKGLDTGVGGEFYDDYTQLSGGEQQKLAIIRLLSKANTDAYILDEPSNNLDPKSEYELYKYIFNEFFDKTIVFISHRLTMATKMDKIFVIENGRIVEEGNHDNLFSNHGIYYDMFITQSEKYK